MDDVRKGDIYELSQISKTLFWINLLPAIVAGIVWVYCFFLLLLRGFIEPLLAMIALGSGLFAEVIYYRQFTDEDYTFKKFGWIYSIVINGLFIAAHIVAFIISPSWAICIIIYPVFFLIESSIGLNRAIKLNRS